MRLRSMRASTGAVPEEDIATVTGSRSITEGVMKLQSSVRSTILTGIPRARASADRARRSTSGRDCNCGAGAGGYHVDQRLQHLHPEYLEAFRQPEHESK